MLFNVHKEEVHAWANVSTFPIKQEWDHEESSEDEQMDLQDLLRSLREMPTPPAMEDSPQLSAAAFSFFDLEEMEDCTSTDFSNLGEELLPLPLEGTTSSATMDTWDPCAEFLL